MIKDQFVVTQILEMIETLIEASEYLGNLVSENNYVVFENISSDINNMISSIHNAMLNIKEKENVYTNIDIACESAQYSLSRIMILSKARSQNTMKKIEFELIPILEDMYLQLYFWGCIYPEPKKMKDYYENEILRLCSNKYIDQAEKNGNYKYDISIIITGYNKLEYTKICIENFLKYVPSDINYELILINHGSTDNTKEYFESIAPTKQLDILKNGSSPSVGFRIIEGKYFLSISNDVLITKDSIANMIRCIESDENIAWVVSSTPNVSNLQAIESNYNNIEDMHKFACKNNKSNPYRWEQRTRLCNPIDIRRSNICLSSSGIGWGGYFHSSTMMSFPDDKLSLLLRRKGYKIVLAKDSYCYHFGSITLKDETKEYKGKAGNDGQQAFYDVGRKEFQEVFGIDPWGIGYCWDPALIQHLPCHESGHVDILGINCGIGSNPLKIKESIKENTHNLDVITYNVTDEECHIEDLKGVSDIAEYINDFSCINDVFGDKKFKYIIFESKLETYKNPLEIIFTLKNRTINDGIIAIKTMDKSLKLKIKNSYSKAIQSKDWLIIK